jgi:hypothetical protein
MNQVSVVCDLRNTNYESKLNKQYQINPKLFTVMKKFIYAALLALVVSMSLYSCTEEVVKPKDGGGNVEEPIVK